MLAAFIALLIIIRWWRNDRHVCRSCWKVKYPDLIFGSDSDQTKTTVATYNEELVRIERVEKKTIRDDKTLQKDMCTLNSLCHKNLTNFIGACVDPPNICVLWEHCSRGGLEDLLLRSDVQMDSILKLSIALDIANGLLHLHSSHIKVHGNLKISSCVVDDHWEAKITDFGLGTFRKGEKQKKQKTLDDDEEQEYRDLFWKSPQRLRSAMDGKKESITRESDVYSLGIILKQILCKNRAYGDRLHSLNAKEIIMKVAHPEIKDPLMRPYIPEEVQHQSVAMATLTHLIRLCWSEAPSSRPSARRIVKKLKRVSSLNDESLWGAMTATGVRYSSEVWWVVGRSERQIAEGQEASHPEQVIPRMTTSDSCGDIKTVFQDVTVCFWNIVDFTSIAFHSSPSEVIQVLNDVNDQFNNIIKHFHVRKMATVCDSSMVVSGCPTPITNHASIMADVSVLLVNSLSNVIVRHRPRDKLLIRIGLNSGPVVAAVVGKSTPRFCLFGDTVRRASYMEFNGLPQKIHLSSSTHKELQDCGKYIMEPRHPLLEKSAAVDATFWLNGCQLEMEGENDG